MGRGLDRWTSSIQDRAKGGVVAWWPDSALLTANISSKLAGNNIRRKINVIAALIRRHYRMIRDRYLTFGIFQGKPFEHHTHSSDCTQ